MNYPEPLSSDAIFSSAPFEQPKKTKEPFMLEGLSALTAHHKQHSESYANMIRTIFGRNSTFRSMASVPWLPVRLFKQLDLKSVPAGDVVRTLTSSGTTGQAVSKIFLDKETASIQTKALAKISTAFLGKKRQPMMIIDDDSFLRDRTKFTARAAGILGFSNLGRSHFYALNEELEPKWDDIGNFISLNSDSPILLFGFTFIIWQQFLEAAVSSGKNIRFPTDSVLVHGGGWKKLVDKNIDNDAFKAALSETFNINRVYNYYGMVEQVGSIFFECEQGFLHTPNYADIIVRDKMKLTPLENGEEGIIQVLSLLPKSYPGHSLMTDDVGVIFGEDDCDCGRMGKRFAVAGRLPNVEIRGCSDTRTTP